MQQQPALVPQVPDARHTVTPWLQEYYQHLYRVQLQGASWFATVATRMGCWMPGDATDSDLR
jgi:hypothetical protein